MERYRKQVGEVGSEQKTKRAKRLSCTNNHDARWIADFLMRMIIPLQEFGLLTQIQWTKILRSNASNDDASHDDA